MLLVFIVKAGCFSIFLFCFYLFICFAISHKYSQHSVVLLVKRLLMFVQNALQSTDKADRPMSH